MTDITPLTDTARELAAEVDQIHILLTGAEGEAREYVDPAADLHSRLLVAARLLEAAADEGAVSEIDLQDFDQRLSAFDSGVE